MAAKVFGDAERSQTIALKALAYLAGDPVGLKCKEQSDKNGSDAS